MTKYFKYERWAKPFTAGVLLLFFSLTAAAECRPPAAAGSFYPESADALKQVVEKLTRKAAQTKVSLPDDKPLRALIMPHAGYRYSGYTAAHAAAAIKKNRSRFTKVIILAPDHRVGFSGCGISPADAYETPLGEVPVHSDAENLIQKHDFFSEAPAASEKKEHAVEVILPFLQTWLDHFEIVPVVTGRADPARITRAISPLIDPATLIVVSSDLSHYLPYKKAVEKDRDTINKIVNLESEPIYKSRNRACGRIPIASLIRLARQRDWEPVLIHYSNSGDATGNHGRVVGYTVIAFYGGQSMSPQKITKKQGKALVQLARKTILESLGIKAKEPDIDLEKEEALQAHRGTFVTLNLNGNLRGCIGSLTADESIIAGVKRNAVNAAFKDPRFPPLTKEEAGQIDIEVSILTDPQSLEYEDANDLLAKLCPEVDGVIIKKGLARATFLPQVWEQLPDRTTFLEHLCAKAGLPQNAWEQGDLEVYTYQVQYFESS